MHGLARALVANAVRGVTEGFKKDLDIVGVGYRAELKGKTLVLALGLFAPDRIPDSRGHHDHRREADAHEWFAARIKAQVGQVSANLRALRPPDPYKQKGIRISGERLKKKAGKAGAAKTAG